MAKDPVLPLYYNDITTSTQDWTDEEFGAYVRLLIHQWRQGGLPKDYQRLTRIATSLNTNWPLLKEKFQEVDGLLKNPVMEEIRLKRDKHKEKQRENVLKRYQKSTKQPTKKLPLEEEIENENEIENEILNEYSNWTNSILDRNDFLFWNKFRNEQIPESDNTDFWIRDHLDLLNRYPKMRPPNQGAFRRSCLKHIRENYKKQINGTGKQHNGLTKVQQQQANNLQALRDQSAAVFGKQQ